MPNLEHSTYICIDGLKKISTNLRISDFKAVIRTWHFRGGIRGVSPYINLLCNTTMHYCNSSSSSSTCSSSQGRCICSYLLLLLAVVLVILLRIWGTAVAQLVEALRYKSEGRGFDSRWCHWNFSLT